MCFASTLKESRDKFQPKAIPYVFVRYLFGKKSYKLYDIKTQKNLFSRDMHFYENIFPFHFEKSDYSFMSLIQNIPCDHETLNYPTFLSPNTISNSNFNDINLPNSQGTGCSSQNSNSSN